MVVESCVLSIYTKFGIRAFLGLLIMKPGSDSIQDDRSKIVYAILKINRCSQNRYMGILELQNSMWLLQVDISIFSENSCS